LQKRWPGWLLEAPGRVGRWQRLQVSSQQVSQYRFGMLLDEGRTVKLHFARRAIVATDDAKMADTGGLRLIGLAFAIVTLSVSVAAVVVNADAERFVQSTSVAK
jgi:hypothetical protein